MLEWLRGLLGISLSDLVVEIAELAGVSIADVCEFGKANQPKGVLLRIVIAIACLERRAYALAAYEVTKQEYLNALLAWEEDQWRAYLAKLTEDQNRVAYDQATHDHIKLVAKNIYEWYSEDIKRNLAIFESTVRLRTSSSSTTPSPF